MRRLALLVVLPCVLVASEAAVALRELPLEGREIRIVEPAVTPPRAILLWLHEPGGKAGTARDWWRRSGLVERGLVVVCPQALRYGWSHRRDRSVLLRALLEERLRSGIGHGQVIIGGEGAAAAVAQELAAALPHRFAGAVLLRGIAGQDIPAAGEQRPRCAVLADWNDPEVPIASIRHHAARWQDAGYALRLEVGSGRGEVDARGWRLTERLLAECGVELAAAAPAADVVPAAGAATAAEASPATEPEGGEAEERDTAD